MSAWPSRYRKSSTVAMRAGAIRVLTSFLRSSSVTCRLLISLSIESDLDLQGGACLMKRFRKSLMDAHHSEQVTMRA